jgi:hypothetical protein
MPYEVRESGDKCEVINTESGDVKATHEPPDAREKAERQVRLLNEVEQNEGWEE